MKSPRVAVLLALGVLLATPGNGVRRERLELSHFAIELPGAPSAVVPGDLDGDGLGDLTIFVAYTEWDRISIEERTRMQGVEGLVEVLTVVPALFDRREIRLLRGLPEGGFADDTPPLPVDSSVLSLAAGHSGAPVVALTDNGLSALRLAETDAGRRLELEAILEATPILAGTGTFFPDLGLFHEIDGQPPLDLVLPTREGLVVHRGTPDGFALLPSVRLEWPRFEDYDAGARAGYFPSPTYRDADADGLDDLVLRRADGGWEGFFVYLNRGAGRFEPLAGPLGELPVDPLSDDDGKDEGADEGGDVVFFGDLDGDGRTEFLTQEELAPEDAGFRKEMKHAKRPPHRYRVFRSTPDLSPEAGPSLEFEATGWSFPGESDFQIPGGLQDLNGDGRLDLVALTLDFSIFQAVRILTTKSLKIGIDFHVLCQQEDGRFREVGELDLSGVFKFDLNNLRMGQVSLFDGDFDGDGRADFVQLGRGRKVSIHRGGEACDYPADPDLVVELLEEPKDLALTRIDDLDGDGLSDLLVVQPQEDPEPGVSQPVRMDLYLSGGTR